MREGELTTLRDNLKRARKFLTSSPGHLRAEREAEAERLALAVKRAESSVNRDKREKVEQEALGAIKKEERTKRQKGKKAFWLKNGGSFVFFNHGY
jgi:ribosomal RNA-processing protein 36